jgi:rhamnosyltransferase
MLVSIIVRTYNEQRYLDRLLRGICEQERQLDGSNTLDVETIVVDSGSTDRTVEIAEAHKARVCRISQQQFSFGRSLNFGCEQASGDVLVFVSGHCVPADRKWLRALVHPIVSGQVDLAYGRQLGGETTLLSEGEVFAKLYPERSTVPQDGFFCNNANAAVSAPIWRNYKFDEELLGLEDMHLGKRLVESGGRLGYVAEAAVFHYHHESWPQVRRRYEREAIALQRIRPEWHVKFVDFLRYFVASIVLDSAKAVQHRRFTRNVFPIVMFRLMQYWGTYAGNRQHRQLADREKHLYFYPK